MPDHKVVKVGTPVDVEIPQEALEALRSLPRKKRGSAVEWPPWKDQVLLQNWNDEEITKVDLAKRVLKVAYNTALTRYRKLTEDAG